MTNLLSKLIALNSLVIILVILLAGLSITDYACFLVNSENITGQELVDTLNEFLFKISIFSFIFVGLFHYFTVKKIISPIRSISEAAKSIREGQSPSNIAVSASGEMKELIDSFNSMTRKLEEVQEQREEMLRDISHELRTPLTNMNGYLEALQHNVIEGNPELFSSLLEESKRITRIVELITEMNSWDDGNYFSDRTFESVQLDQVISESLKTFELKTQNCFENIDTRIEKGKILGNKDGLMQVFANILQNILDYNTGDFLKISGSSQEQKYVISLTHTGLYIDPDKKDLIFERFYRLEDSRSTKAAGAGLGLSIAKSIVAAHKGKIGIYTDGHQHTFWIELPSLK
jgi:two-component system, OmpR family, sensor histidine kinase BaeS